MAIVMGPVVKFHGEDKDAPSWNLSVIVVCDTDPGALTWRYGDSTVQISATVLLNHGNHTVYRYAFTVALGETPRKIEYRISGKPWTVALPARGFAPRIAYTSCNGFSSLKVMKSVKVKNRMWSEMAEQHEKAPYGLLIMGGDQLYADSMWEVVPTMKAWNELSADDGNKAAFTPQMQQELADFYFSLYVQRWSQPEVAAMLASIPTIMMWDDHDIIDGWGSYPKKRHECPVFQGIFAAARRAFAVFQQHLAQGETPAGVSPAHGFSVGYTVGNIAVLALDMRSERTEKIVLTPAHWEDVYRWMDALADLDHLLVLSSIPVVYPGFDTVERVLGLIPGQQELEDDLRDHWNSRPHKGERLRLIHRLLRFADKTQIRPTLISGDVHVAALGIIESSRAASGGHETVINQLISSGIVHPGPPGVMLFALRYLFDSEDEIDRGITARMTEFPGVPHKFIGVRNYLSLDLDAKAQGARIWANWFVENEHDPFVKAIHPLRGAEAIEDAA